MPQKQDEFVRRKRPVADKGIFVPGFGTGKDAGSDSVSQINPTDLTARSSCPMRSSRLPV